MGLLRDRVTKELDYQGVKHLGVTRLEYGDRLGYRAQTLFGIAETAVRTALRFPSHVSETNRKKALDAAIPTLRET